jgi:hypothetical protein
VLRPRDEQHKVEEFDWLRTDILAENKRWLYAVHDKATSRVSSVQERTNKGDRESLATLQRVEQQTLIEIGKGYMGQPWSLSDLLATYTNLADCSLRCRVLLRSGVLQGGLREEVHVGPDGRHSVTTVRKLRVIDDAKMSRHNDLQQHCETIHLYDFTYSGLVAQELVEQCRARSWKFNGPPPMTDSSRAVKCARRCTLAREPRDFDVPQLVFGCEDLTSSFRLCPVAEPEMNIVAVYYFTPPPGYSEPGVYYFPVFGHCFGFVSSINNFSTMTALFCTIGRYSRSAGGGLRG